MHVIYVALAKLFYVDVCLYLFNKSCFFFKPQVSQDVNSEYMVHSNIQSYFI